MLINTDHYPRLRGFDLIFMFLILSYVFFFPFFWLILWEGATQTLFFISTTAHVFSLLSSVQIELLRKVKKKERDLNMVLYILSFFLSSPKFVLFYHFSFKSEVHFCCMSKRKKEVHSYEYKKMPFALVYALFCLPFHFSLVETGFMGIGKKMV